MQWFFNLAIWMPIEDIDIVTGTLDEGWKHIPTVKTVILPLFLWNTQLMMWFFSYCFHESLVDTYSKHCKTSSATWHLRKRVMAVIRLTKWRQVFHASVLLVMINKINCVITFSKRLWKSWAAADWFPQETLTTSWQNLPTIRGQGHEKMMPACFSQ